jgi:hypothetical protein
MKIPHFLRLAQVDNQHFITACRHGLVHLTWGRTTTRFARKEFKRLAALLAQAADNLPPTSFHDGQLGVTYRLDEDCELRVGALVLLLSPADFEALNQTAQEAVRRLDKILASGAWDQEGPEDASPGLIERIQRTPFSRN